MNRHLRRLSVIACGLIPTSAWAHPGHIGTDLASGLAHPVTGLDHLVTMVLIGVSAALLMKRYTLASPALFCASLVAGFAASRFLLSAPVELAVLASLALVGLAVALRANLSASVVLLASAIFGFAHGAAHGIDMPRDAMPTLFVAGFLASSVLLHGAGYWIARTLPVPALRAFGLAGTGLGLVLAVSA